MPHRSCRPELVDQRLKSASRGACVVDVILESSVTREDCELCFCVCLCVCVHNCPGLTTGRRIDLSNRTLAHALDPQTPVIPHHRTLGASTNRSRHAALS